MATESSGLRPIQQFLNALTGAGKKWRRSSTGYVAQCPGHPDDRESLSVSEGDKQPLTLKCHAGCTFEHIIESAGMTVADAMEPRDAGAPVVTSGSLSKRRIVATYDYRDEIGALIYQVVRYEPKEFRQRRPDPDTGEWTWRVTGVQRLLYRLPELHGAGSELPVYWFEGEKDVETAMSLGLVATTTSGGTEGKLDTIDLSVLRGRTVVIVPDKDKPGGKYAGRVADALNRAGAKVIRVNLFDGPEPDKGGKDFSDWVAEGGTVEQLLELQVKREQPDVLADTDRERGVMKPVRDLLAKQFPPAQWAIEGLIRRGKSYLLIGPPKEGKSYLALSLTVAVAMGGRALGIQTVEQGKAAYLCLEDGEEELQERLFQLAGRDIKDIPDLVYSDTWPKADAGGIEDLALWIKQQADAGTPPILVVVDILQQIRSTNRSKGQSVYELDYEALAPLTKLAHDTNCAIVVIHHTNKRQDTDLLDSISGSNALAGAVDGLIGLRVKASGDEEIGRFGRVTTMSRGQRAISWQVERDEHSGGWVRLAESKTGFSREVIEILRVLNNGGKWKPSDIAPAIGKKVESVSQLLVKHLKDGLWRREGYGVYEITSLGMQVLNKIDQSDQTDQVDQSDQTIKVQRPPANFDHSDRSNHFDHSDHFDRPSTEGRSDHERAARRVRARIVIRLYRDHDLEFALNDDGQVRAYGTGSVPDDLAREAADLNEEIADELRKKREQ